MQVSAPALRSSLTLALAPACLGLVLSGCLFYDSRWGESTAEQKRAAARMKPADLEARHEAEPARLRHARVHACATQGYVAETLEWERRFEDLLRDASALLEPAIGLRLESAGAVGFKPAAGGADLDAALGALADCDEGDADWVVGFVESTPRLDADFHFLGKGRSYSKYLVVRAPNDPAEIEALARGLPDLGSQEREKLYADRKHHKNVTLFLHEFAHTLGALHRASRDTIMNPAYDAREAGFDDATVGLLKLTLAARFDRRPEQPVALEYLTRVKDGWIESERRAELDRLATFSSRAKAAPSAPDHRPEPAPSTPARVAFETLPKADRQTYDRALALSHDDPRSAFRLAEPLFKAYPGVLEVQELHCSLAKARQFRPAVVAAHCRERDLLRGSEPEPIVK